LVDQLTLQTISIIVAASSVLVGVAYNILQMREQNKNRQAQLLMQIYNHYLDKISDEEMDVWTMQFNGYDDLIEKYGWEKNPLLWNKFSKFLSYTEGMGTLVRRGLIDASLVYDLNGGLVKWYWEKSRTFWREFGERNNLPHIAPFTEYLYGRLEPLHMRDAAKG
jgi:hypothetical protein